MNVNAVTGSSEVTSSALLVSGADVGSGLVELPAGGVADGVGVDGAVLDGVGVDGAVLDGVGVWEFEVVSVEAEVFGAVLTDVVSVVDAEGEGCGVGLDSPPQAVPIAAQRARDKERRTTDTVLMVCSDERYPEPLSMQHLVKLIADLGLAFFQLAL